MSSVVIAGDTSGTVTLAAPSVAGTTTLTLPSTSGTVVTDATSTGINASALSTGTVPTARLASGTASSSTYLRGDQTWASVSSSPTTAQVLSATAGASLGEVGTYAGLMTTSSFSAGTNITGSNIRYSSLFATSYNQTASIGDNYGSTISGTWKAMGFSTANGYYNFTVFLRVS